MRKVLIGFLECVPILLMIGLIKPVENDWILAGVFVLIILASFFIKKERHEGRIFWLGFLGMMVSEYIFVSTGVETFQRNSLLGVMPVWLPFLWGYGFVVIKRISHLMGR